MKKYISELNKKQKDAVLHTDGPLAIIAGAGSGKTKTLTHKLGYLIQEKRIDPKRILAVTFTNKAANEMKERVIAIVGKKANDATISTYHSLCVRILRREIKRIDYPSNFNILDIVDQKQILKSIYKKENVLLRSLPYSEVLSYISKNKLNYNTPEFMSSEAKTNDEKRCAKIYSDYAEILKKTKSLDFDDLLLFVANIFKDFKEAREYWSKKYDYVLVDEFQDTSLIQYDIVKVLAKTKNITIVGDPDQTIYTWRNADSTLFKKFYNDFKNYKTVVLEHNYRSTKKILDAANKLIKNNPYREEKNLFTLKEEGPDIIYHYGFSEESEARWVAKKIKELNKQGTKLRDIAILYRSNYVSQCFERQMINASIDYIVYGGIKFYQRKEIKDCIAYLKLINGNDDVSMNRVINTPARKLGEKAVEKLLTFAEGKKLGLTDTLMKYCSVVPISSAQKNELIKFLNEILKYRIALKTNPISKTLKSFLKSINYMSSINKINDQSKVENIKELIRSISDWEIKNPGKSLNDYLIEISLYTDTEEKAIKNSDYISLMTVHSAKGLEFKYVFIVAFSEGVFPSLKALRDLEENVYEERRLAYVAVTRTKEQLFITSSKGYAIDFTTAKKPSRFIDELGINIRDHTKEFIAPKRFSENYTEDRNLLEGDRVEHIKFGIGTIVNVQGQIIEISFKDPHGLKTMMKNHKSIKVVE